ncbi:hypothetical protein ACFL2V_22020, partial [Pseudomonadota bacterium]
GDILKVERTGTTVVYKQNGTVFYTSTVPSSGSLIVDASIYSYEAQIANAFVFGASEDSDGDGFNNDLENQLGTDPNDNASVPPDLDGDFIPDSLDDDRDGDSVLNEQDLYPDDGTRFQLAALTGVTSMLLQNTVQISWTPATDLEKLMGYNIYRLPASDAAETKLNPSLIQTVSFIDDTVSNGEGYRYKVVAVDISGNEGAAGNLVEFFVNYNNTPVENLTVQREGLPVHMSWSSISGVRYRISRAEVGGAMQTLTEVTSSEYNDSNPLWSKAYQYQLATLRDFVNPFTSEAITLVGPQTAVYSVQTVPLLAIQLNDTTVATDGMAELRAYSQDRVSISGSYMHALSAVNITATSGTDSITAQSNNGSLNLVLPAQIDTVWSISVTEQAYTDRNVSTTLRIVKDTTPPQINLDAGGSLSVNADSVEIEGAVTDSQSDIDELYLTSDRFADQRFGALIGAGGRFSAEIPLEAGANLMTVNATDAAGNHSTAEITVQRSVSQVPTIDIQSPVSGTTVTANSVTVQGVVYTSLPPEQVRIVLGEQTQFAAASATADQHVFSFTNVALVEGINALNVQVITPAGTVQAETYVTYTTDTGVVQQPAPEISLISPVSAHVSDNSFTLAGSVISYSGAVTATLDGTELTLVGPNGTQGNFTHIIDLSGYTTDTVELDLIITDESGESTQQTITLHRDATPPVLSMTTPGILISPSVNTVYESPYTLSGSVDEANLAGISINGQGISVTPGATATQHNFSAAIELPHGVNQTVTLEAWDKAGNRSSQERIR